MGWRYDEAERVDLDSFEEKRIDERAPNFKKDKKLTKLDRERVLREFGATQTEVQNAAKRATIIRNKRMKSIAIARSGGDKRDEQLEYVLNKLKSIFRPFSSKRSGSGLERLHPCLMASMMGIDDENDVAQ